MIEFVTNLIQLVFYIACSLLIISVKEWPDSDMRLFTLGFFGTYTLANAYWVLFIAKFGVTPPYFYVADLAWIASLAFLALFVARVYRFEGDRSLPKVSWVMIPVLFIPTVWFMIRADPVTNFLSFLPMGISSVFSLGGLLTPQVRKGEKSPYWPFYASVLAFNIVTNLLWCSSIIWKNFDEITCPYHWINMLVCVVFVLIAVFAFRLARVLAKRGEGKGR